jgi:hypothetical protein
MAATETASRIAPYVERLLEDEAARENLRRGATKLRDAYDRSQKRRVKATRDQKLRDQLASAAQSLGTGASALVNGARKPKKRRGRTLLKLSAAAAVGAGIALGLNEGLRSSLPGSSSSPEPASTGSPS